jgi:peptidoglycan/LPS O-acetylase OafA/YrhL
MDAIAAGCLLSSIRERLWACASYRRFLEWKAFWCLLPLLAALNWLRVYPSVSLPFGESLLNLGIALTIDRTVRLPSTFSGNLLNAPGLTYLGRISYSAYLWQQLFLSRDSSAWVSSFPLNLGLALAVGCLSYHVIEVPALRLRASLAALLPARHRLEQASIV